MIRYCNEQCRDNSLRDYHWLECGNVEKLQNTGIGHLAVRTLLITPSDRLLQFELGKFLFDNNRNWMDVE
jgi:hypothetical protein